MTICVAYLGVFELLIAFQCNPVSYFWSSWLDTSGGRCLNVNASALSTTLINIVLDIVVLILPMRPILRLQISLKRKIQVVSMFSVGIL